MFLFLVVKWNFTSLWKIVRCEKLRIKCCHLQKFALNKLNKEKRRQKKNFNKKDFN